ncbi:O-antigen ligase family protein [Arthrobacter sp. efr-133-TYG-104]|uniref:O-antigen ligase family protein n=1 Tax=Arthrobacter sp. efr-133-TYG-104 TaxID=3040324 RepID=UPI00254D262E|nr:O-antigen ligase family protein [Arthrobacter sp. efr-133-TYG-104]
MSFLKVKPLVPKPVPDVGLTDLEVHPGKHATVSFLLRVSAFSIFFFPSNMVLKPLGAVGTVPLMLALLLLLVWLCASFFGLQNPFRARNPGRLGIGLLWLGTCASYVAMFSGLTGNTSIASQASADRWLILILASAGIVLAVSEAVRTVNDALMLVRALLAGALFCCLVAVVQFVLRINPMVWIQDVMVGFTDNGGNTVFQVRGLLTRVAGSTFHSIELAVVCSMMLPLSIWRAIYDSTGRKWLHWTVTALLVFAIASTVSRSGVLGLTISMIVLIPFLPTTARRWALVMAPVALAALFVAVPGLVGTLTSQFTAGSSDLSVSTRTNNYPRVAKLFGELPFLGLGPGNYRPTDALQILDNQYLNSLVTLGLVGFFGMVAYLVLPACSALIAARASRIPALRALAGALAASGAVAAGCSLTFDSMSFPVFALAYPVVVGLSGAVWNMVRREANLRAPGPDRGVSDSPPRQRFRPRPTIPDPANPASPTSRANSGNEGIPWTR